MLSPSHLCTVSRTMNFGSEQTVPILQSYQDAPWSLLSVSVKLESKNISLQIRPTRQYISEATCPSLCTMGIMMSRAFALSPGRFRLKQRTLFPWRSQKQLQTNRLLKSPFYVLIHTHKVWQNKNNQILGFLYGPYLKLSYPNACLLGLSRISYGLLF